MRWGVIGGLTLNQLTQADVIDQVGPTTQRYFASFEPRRSGIVGPHIEYALNDKWSFLAEATYRQIRVRHRTEFTQDFLDRDPVRVSMNNTLVPAILWQFPVLAKRRFQVGGVHPFVEGGPSFRLSQEYNGFLSNYGITGGAGVGLSWKAMRIEPGLRISHWGPARNAFFNTIEPNSTRRNQLDGVVVVTF